MEETTTTTTAEDEYAPLFELARGESPNGLLEPEAVALAAKLKRVDSSRWLMLKEALAKWSNRSEVYREINAFLRRVDNNKARRRATEEVQKQAEEAGLPLIELDNADLPGMLERAEEVLAEPAADGVFQAHGRLVRMFRHNNADEGEEESTEGPLDWDDQPLRRPENALLVGDIGDKPLQVLLAKRAMWVAGRGGKDTLVEPPLRYAQHLVAAAEWRRIPVLLGTTEAPTLRANGTILQKPGYDRHGKLYFNDGAVSFPPVPGRPSRDEALAALELLKKPIALFPFVENEDGSGSASRSVALSAMLTVMIRRTLETAPVHAFDAPQAGSGKTKLLSLPAIMATGRPPVMVSQGSNDEEFNKRLFSVLRAGDLVIGFDNIVRPIGTDELNLVLTAPSWQSRILGESRNATVATNALICFTGNNLEFVGDITDRALVCRIEPNVETPSARRFPFDPLDYTLAHRAALAVAALTVIRGFLMAGLPGVKDLTPSRFPAWDKTARGALVWLGEADPYSTHDDLRKVDPETEDISALYEAWHEAFGLDRKVMAKDVGEYAGLEQGGALATALGGDLGARAIGKRLKRVVGRITGPYVLRAKPDSHANALSFWLEKAPPPPDGPWNNWGF